MSTDEAKKQYFIFAAIISFILSFVLNFFFFGLINGPFFGGFPINVATSNGIGEIISRLINTGIMGLLLIVPIFYFLQWIQRRGAV